MARSVIGEGTKAQLQFCSDKETANAASYFSEQAPAELPGASGGGGVVLVPLAFARRRSPALDDIGLVAVSSVSSDGDAGRMAIMLVAMTRHHKALGGPPIATVSCYARCAIR